MASFWLLTIVSDNELEFSQIFLTPHSAYEEAGKHMTATLEEMLYAPLDRLLTKDISEDEEIIVNQLLDQDWMNALNTWREIRDITLDLPEIRVEKHEVSYN